MMEYNVALPTSQAATFKPNDTVTFKLGYKPNRSIVRNSVRLTFFWNVTVGGNAPTQATSQFMPAIGAQSLIQYLSIAMGQVGIVESNPEYPQLYNAWRLCNNSPNNISADSRYITELQNPNITISKAMPCRNVDGQKPVSLKPMCCLNRTSGNIAFDKIKGDITVTLRLSDINTSLFGANNYAYTIPGQTFKLTYMTVPTTEQEMKESLTYEYFTYNKVNMASDNFQLSSVNPGVCKAMCITSCVDANFSAVDKDKTTSVRLPGLSRIQFMINNSVGQVINFPLDNVAEIERNFWLSLSESRDKSFINYQLPQAQSGLANSDCSGIGLNFGELIDMRQQSFNVNIEASLAGTAFKLFAFFKNVAVIE